MDKKFDERFDKQNKELAQELRNITGFICKRQDKQFEKFLNSQNKKMQEFFKTNRIEHDAYNAKMYKIELGQSNLEEKIYHIEKEKMNKK